MLPLATYAHPLLWKLPIIGYTNLLLQHGYNQKKDPADFDCSKDAELH